MSRSVPPGRGEEASLRRRGRPSPRGFTLLELVVVITIIAILAASLVPIVTQPYITEKRLETVSEMGQIEDAILGRYEYSDPGFLGTIGKVPGATDTCANSIQDSTGLKNHVTDLLTNSGSTYAAATTTPATPSGAPQGYPYGWNGPYLRSQFQDPTRDAWGDYYYIGTYQNSACTTPGCWFIQSAGPDHQCGTSDDIVFPATQSTQYFFLNSGDLIVEVAEGYGLWEQPPGSTEINSVVVWFPDGTGKPTSQQCQLVTGTTAIFDCYPKTNGTVAIPFGIPQVQITFNGGGKFGANPYTFTTEVTHRRLTSYQKVVVPITSLSAIVQASPATYAGNRSAAGNSFTTVIGPITEPQMVESQLLEVNVWGTLQLPGDATTTCVVYVQSSPDGSTWSPQLTSSSSQSQIEAVGGAMGSNANAGEVPYSFTYQAALAGGSGQTYYQVVLQSIGSSSCQVDGTSLLINQFFTSP